MLSKLLAGFVALAALAAPSIASAAEVYVYRPRPVSVHRTVVIAPVPVAHVCKTRVMRVWVNGRYISRAVRTCS
jgi:hypothetical protein